MNRTQRVEALKQVIAHTIKGERELAEALFKEVTTASAREILGEGNYALDDDPEFDGRREMQRELEDDLESGEMEPGADEMGGAEGPCEACGSEECPGCDADLGVGGDADKTIEDIVSKLENGDVDDEVLSMILAMVSEEGEGEEGAGEPELPSEPTEPTGEEGAGGEEGSAVGPDGEIDLGALMKSEGVGDSQDLLKKIKFALEYDYDQFLDSGGDQSEWADIALSNPSPELEQLLLQIPANQKAAYDSIIEKFVRLHQGGGSAQLKDLL